MLCTGASFVPLLLPLQPIPIEVKGPSVHEGRWLKWPHRPLPVATSHSSGIIGFVVIGFLGNGGLDRPRPPKNSSVSGGGG